MPFACGKRMGRGRLTAFLTVAVAACLPTPAGAQSPRPPVPDPNFAGDVLPRPCALDTRDPYEREFIAREGWAPPEYERYPGACTRMRFVYGPIVVKPGQNDVLIGPVTIEKPAQDGFITRFKPNLVLHDGTTPPVEQVHLHHGTWLSVPDYGSGPFFAAGEEKTVAPYPKGYGMQIRADDKWLLLYMVHSAVQESMVAYITYDVDFVPQAKAQALGLKPAVPIWLDVRPSGYPVFNTQRSFGGADGRCTWPKEQCAAFDPWGETFVGQGEAGNGVGTDLKLPARGESLGSIENFTGGTLIGIGGHLHPGGLENEIDLVRDGKATRIYTGQAVYWDWKDPSKPGGPPTSWDFSMEVIGAPWWGVRVKPGDALRSNAVYDTTYQSTYENMGISVALLAPDTPDGKPTAPGVDPFTTPKDRSEDCKTGGLLAPELAAAAAKKATKRKPGAAKAKKKSTKRKPKPKPRGPYLCDKGIVTHGHLPENANHSGPAGAWNAKRGSPTDDVRIVDFLYYPGDLTTISMTGVPTVKLGTALRFLNVDGLSIYHTVTSCAFPCLGPTGSAFPLADGRSSKGRNLDFDSSELGIGAPYIGPAKQTVEWDLPVTQKDGFQPGEIVTYFCRIHPSMRGAFEVAP
jgi:plastocyanin